jgi:hypothetical protein
MAIFTALSKTSKTRGQYLVPLKVETIVKMNSVTQTGSEIVASAIVEDLDSMSIKDFS